MSNSPANLVQFFGTGQTQTLSASGVIQWPNVAANDVSLLKADPNQTGGVIAPLERGGIFLLGINIVFQMSGVSSRCTIRFTSGWTNRATATAETANLDHHVSLTAIVSIPPGGKFQVTAEAGAGNVTIQPGSHMYLFRLSGDDFDVPDDEDDELIPWLRPRKRPIFIEEEND